MKAALEKVHAAAHNVYILSNNAHFYALKFKMSLKMLGIAQNNQIVY